MSIKTIVHDCNSCKAAAQTDASCSSCYVKSKGFTQYLPEDVSFFMSESSYLITYKWGDITTLVNVSAYSLTEALKTYVEEFGSLAGIVSVVCR
jgi:hypothetical protein